MAKEGTGAAAWLRRRLGLAAPFDALLLGWAPCALCLGAALASASHTRFAGPGGPLLLHQDLPVFWLCIGLTAVAGLGALQRLWRLPASPSWSPRALAAALAVFCVVAGALGGWLLFHGFSLSLDEYLANFDAQIFAHGQLMAPVAPEWRPLVPALQPIYMVPVPDHAFWGSGYLPLNAALRAIGSRAGLEWLVNPLLSGVAVIGVYAVARRLWPDRPEMALGAAALLASSSQLILTAMTAYAMPAHLAFNLAWLWLFLRGGRLGHAGAIAVGFLASGLHQFLFHPLFAAPFVLQLWLDGRRRLAGVYTLAYALICLFWIEYWQLALAWLGEPARAAASAGGGWIAQRAAGVISAIRPGNLGAMATALIRFVTWQNPVTVPLALLGGRAALRAGGTMRALLLGLMLTLLVMLLIQPTQTEGWGYRYAHGLLGSLCLLAIWSWARLTDAMTAPARLAATQGLVAACALSLLVLLPIRAWQAWSYVRPAAAASALIQASSAPVVFVDDEQPWFNMGAVVRNDPYLAKGPKVLLLTTLTEPSVRTLCAHGPVGLFDGRQAAALGLPTYTAPPDPRLPRLRAVMAEIKCGVPLS